MHVSSLTSSPSQEPLARFPSSRLSPPTPYLAKDVIFVGIQGQILRLSIFSLYGSCLLVGLPPVSLELKVNAR